MFFFKFNRLTRRISTKARRKNSTPTNKDKNNNNTSQTNTLFNYFPIISSSTTTLTSSTSPSLSIKILPAEPEKYSKYFKWTNPLIE